MRLNKFIAQATGISRRAADVAITEQRVTINGQIAQLGSQVEIKDAVEFNGTPVTATELPHTIILNKPVGYVVSRNGQGSQTVYDLLPGSFHTLKPIGRLDKDSSGLLMLTSDGKLAQELTHPSHRKIKRYEVILNKSLLPLHRQMINDIGISLADGVSQLGLDRLIEGDDKQWLVTMHEGRNRQIRRTFEALGYKVTRLHRVQFASYQLHGLALGHYRDAE